jgi:hypothetical protein
VRQALVSFIDLDVVVPVVDDVGARRKNQVAAMGLKTHSGPGKVPRERTTRLAKIPLRAVSVWSRAFGGNLVYRR